jgi:hypothetical protein
LVISLFITIGAHFMDLLGWAGYLDRHVRSDSHFVAA